VPVSHELADWWRARSQKERAGIGALAGTALAWAAWQLRHPALGFDTVHYHLPEMVLFVQGGHPGSIHDVLPGLPVGNYPVTTEVTIAWAMGIARSFVPIILVPWLTLALAATSAHVGLRTLGVSRPLAILAAAALCTNPWLLGWQSNGSVTDGPALAWLLACAALTALSRRRPALLAAAIVAGGLAIGCKTTVLPFTLLVLALGLWAARKSLPAKAIALATAVATLVGGVWYLRNLVTHGSPFWPIVGTPWGDPVPDSVKSIQTSFLDRPGATVDVLGHAYLSRFGGGVLLLAAGVLAPLAAPRSRRVLVTAAALVAGLLLWAQSPITGIAVAGPLPETVFSTTRYTLPMVAAACLALALAATEGRRLKPLALPALAAAVGVNVVQTFRLDFPFAPSPLTPLAGAALGAALALAVGFVGRGVHPRIGRRARAAAALIAASLAGALLAIPASGFVKRHADTHSVLVSIVVRELAYDPAFEHGTSPIATTPAYIGPLAGDRLRHRLEAIPPHSSCADAARRAKREWLVVYGGPLGGVAPAQVKRCLPPPAFDNGPFAVFKPPRP
jgi:hypothetical protein